MFGPNALDLCRMMTEELKKSASEAEGEPADRTRYEIDEMLPEEAVGFLDTYTH